MPKKKSKTKKLEGKTVAFAGKFGFENDTLPRYEGYVEAEGGAVVDSKAAVPDYLVVGQGRGGKPPAIVAQLRGKHPEVEILNENELFQLLELTSNKSEGMNFDAFYARLGQKIEKARITKATQMLKADRFQLFADVKDDTILGVVKSQTDPELVYSCRLTSEGTFGCCTQNLRPCGGLRGSLCKHLLVLILGLTKAAEFDPAAADAWIDSSRTQKPDLDKDLMSETFLRYKGAEAGEVDWRPTETIPEDYYAL